MVQQVNRARPRIPRPDANSLNPERCERFSSDGFDAVVQLDPMREQQQRFRYFSSGHGHHCICMRRSFTIHAIFIVERGSGWPISRVLYDFRSGHSSRTFVAERLQRLTRGQRGGPPASWAGILCSALLRVGFTMRDSSPTRRCALTAPFHHDRHPKRGRTANCSLWHYPEGFPWSPLAITLARRSPDFPPVG